jgi:hypothetical protein
MSVGIAIRCPEPKMVPALDGALGEPSRDLLIGQDRDGAVAVLRIVRVNEDSVVLGLHEIRDAASS